MAEKILCSQEPDLEISLCLACCNNWSCALFLYLLGPICVLFGTICELFVCYLQPFVNLFVSYL